MKFTTPDHNTRTPDCVYNGTRLRLVQLLICPRLRFVCPPSAMILAVMDNYMHMAQPWLQTGAFQAMLLDFYPNRALQDKPRSVLTLMNKHGARLTASNMASKKAPYPTQVTPTGRIRQSSMPVGHSV